MKEKGRDLARKCELYRWPFWSHLRASREGNMKWLHVYFLTHMVCVFIANLLLSWVMYFLKMELGKIAQKLYRDFSLVIIALRNFVTGSQYALIALIPIIS